MSRLSPRAALFALGLIFIAVPAQADLAASKAAVDAAKAAGIVGEQADGMLGFVHGSDPVVAGAVAEINDGRANAYRGIAAKTGTSPEAAGQATAKELIAKMAPGTFYKPLDGAWTRK